MLHVFTLRREPIVAQKLGGNPRVEGPILLPLHTLPDGHLHRHDRYMVVGLVLVQDVL